MWSDRWLNFYLWFLYSVKDGKVIDDKSIDQKMESWKSRMLIRSMWPRMSIWSTWSRISTWSMWPRMSIWSMWPRMSIWSMWPRMSKYPSMAKNGKNDRTNDVKSNERTQRKVMLQKKILFNCFIEFERWIFQKFDFYYYFYWTDRINMSDSLGRRGSMLYSIHFMVYIGVKYHKVSSQVLSTWHIMCQWY